MRFLLLLCLCAGLGSGAEAQPQEELKQETKVVQGINRGLEERLNNPDRSDSNLNSAQGKTFDTKAFSGNKVVSTKDFYFEQKVKPKSFLTRMFSGGKTSSDATKTFATGAAATKGKYEIPNAGTTLAPKPYDTREANDAGKRYATRDYATKQTTVIRGAAQGSIDEQYQHGPLTFDQVRELLNKNK